MDRPTTLGRPLGRPDALVDLRTAEGVRLVRGQWRYADAKVVEVDAKGPGPAFVEERDAFRDAIRNWLQVSG